MGGLLTGESACRRGGGMEPRGGLPDPQSSPAYWHQMSYKMLWVTSRARLFFKLQLIIAAIKVQAPAATSAAYFIADAHALP